MRKEPQAPSAWAIAVGLSNLTLRVAALTKKARRLGLQVVVPGELVEAAPAPP